MIKHLLISVLLTIPIAALNSQGTFHLGLPDTANDSSIVDNLLLQSNNNYKVNRNTTPALDPFITEALDICNKAGLIHQKAYIYNMIGKREREKSNFSSALKYCTQAVQLAEQLGDKKMLSEYNNQLGVVFRRIDEHAMATTAHMKALRYAEEAQDSFNISVALNSLGNIKISLNQNNTAIEYFRKSISLSEKMKNLRGLAMNYNNIGEAFLSLRQTDSALFYFEKSLYYNERINSNIGQAISFTSIGNVYLEKKEYNKALDYFNKSLVMHGMVGDVILLANTHVKLGKAFIVTGNTSEGIKHLEKALKMATGAGSKYIAAEASSQLATLYEKTGQYPASIAMYKLNSQYNDSLINEKSLQHIATMEMLYNSEKKDRRIEELNKQAQLTEKRFYKQKYLSLFFVSFSLLSIIIFLLVLYQLRLKNRIKTLKSKQRLLRLQMNPHFIFNVLNALQLYILENDQEKSSDLLSSLSKLMRSILQTSNYEYIPIKDEESILNDYLKIQQLRFLDPFRFSLTVDDELKIDNTAIPPMLTQPFIENAIEHGFRQIDSSCSIDIRMFRSDKSVIIEIIDNGIGIKNIKNNNEHSHKHKSMATTITKERLMVLQKETGKKAMVEIEDRSEKSDEHGTVVRFTIPLLTLKP
jgi:tetratricopeptide (TPR) repeat protein